RVGGPAAQIGQVGLGVDEVSARGTRLLESGEDRVHDGTGLPVHVALALDDPAGVQRGGAGDEDAVTDAHRPRVRILVLDGAPGRDAPGRGGRAIDRVEFDLDEL